MRDVIGGILVLIIPFAVGVKILVWQGQVPPPVESVDKPPAVVAPKATVTPLQQAQIDLIALKQQLAFTLAERDQCRGASAPATYQQTMAGYQQELNAMVKAFEQAYPGWTLDLKTKQAVRK